MLRAALWCALWLAGAAAAAGGFVHGWRLMLEPARFPVRRIAVRGGVESLNGEVAASLSGLMNRNMFTMDLHAIESQTLSHPWVREASVWRQIPGTIHVLIAPRTVAALVQEAGGIRMFSADAADLGPLTPRFADEDHTIITGVESGDAAERSARVVRGIRALRRLESAEPAFVSALSTLNVSRADRLEATLRDFWPPVYLNPADPALNVERLPSLRRQLAAGGVLAAYVDLRFRDRIAVLPENSSEVPSGA